MKNKIFSHIHIHLIGIFFLCLSTAHAFTFKTSEILISENGNIITATDGIAESIENNIEIKAQTFIYDKKLSILKAKEGIANSYIDNIEIKADDIIFNELTSIVDASGNVELRDLSKNVLIESENIIFNTKKKTIESKIRSSIKDKLGNVFLSDTFSYSIENGLVKAKNVEFKDLEKNKLTTKKAYINLKKNKFIAKDISINFNDGSFTKENDPRLKGNSISVEDNNSTVIKGVFTTCKKNDDCPPWAFAAQEIKHDKKKKTIFYKNAWLKIYDQPVFYFPKFFHPDPTVKRQSGFLIPSIQSSSNVGNSFNIPYFFVIADNKDLTLNTRIYGEDKILIQSEYREIRAESKSSIDFSIKEQKNYNSKTHFFAESEKNINFDNFDDSELKLKLELVSDDTYLKTYKVQSPLITNDNLLRSSIGVSAFREDLSLEGNFYVYEDLSKPKSDRYEFIYPDYKLEKKLENSFDVYGNLLINSSGYLKNYNKNVFEEVVINDLIFNSKIIFTKSGFKNKYNLKLKNINTNSTNSQNYKDERDHQLLSIAEFNSSYPLKKIGDKYDSTLLPMFSLRYSPNSTKNHKDEDRRIDINNIFSFDRLGKNNSVEGGASLTYGSEYFATNKLDRKIFTAKLANNLRLKEEENLPQNSYLWKKTSDFVANLKYDPSDFFNVNYDFSMDENLSDTSYQKIDTQIKINNFITTFGYLNENNTKNDQSYLFNSTKYNFDASNNLRFETRQNKETKLTEFYNLIYEYRNDCLIAALEYNKDYYDIGDKKPEENIFFKLTIVPFGQTSSPNLKK